MTIKKPKWQRNFDDAAELEHRHRTRKPRRVHTRTLEDLKAGDVVWYRPANAEVPHSGERGTVTRPPRLDVEQLMLTVEFADGHRQRVTFAQLQIPAPQPPYTVTPALGATVTYTPVTPTANRAGQTCVVKRQPTHTRKFHSVRLQFRNGDEVNAPLEQISLIHESPNPTEYLDAARRTRSWAFLVTQAGDPATQVEAEARARQLAGILTPKAVASIRPQLTVILLEEAKKEAAKLAEQKALLRGRRGEVRHPHLPVPTDEAANLKLDQEQRWWVNKIAEAIHQRWFLSDADVLEKTTKERQQEKITGVLSVYLRKAQSDAGMVPVKSDGNGKGSAVFGQLHDALADMYALALESCQMAASGKADHALTLALQVQTRRREIASLTTQLRRDQPQHSVGRYFHGDVLSVREQHEDGGMTQYYARVTFIYHDDGHNLIVANAPEIESLSGMRVGAQAWTSLCRWVLDMSDREDGRQQGRRQEDREHLIYRDDDGHLRQRDLAKYPNIIRALEAIRRTLLMDHDLKDVLESEIPLGKPLPGEHPPLSQAEPRDGGA